LTTCCEKRMVSGVPLEADSGFSNKKFQITNNKQITMTEFQNLKQEEFFPF